MSDPKFAVGDRVVTANRDHVLPYNQSTPDGVEFVITKVCKSGQYYYEGDPEGCGIWESRLRLVSAAVSPEQRERELRADAVMAFASHCLKYPEWLLARTWAEQIRNGEHDGLDH